MSKLITDTIFLQRLVKNRGIQNQGQTVHHSVVIDGSKSNLPTVTLVGQTFTGSVTIQNFSYPQFFVHLEDSHFGELIIRDVTGSSINIRSCTVNLVSLWRCRLKTAYLEQIAVKRLLDTSGLQLSEGLFLRATTFGDLRLLGDPNRKMWIKTPWVQTDSLEASRQFELAKIPVFVPTSIVRQDLCLRGKLPKSAG